MILLMAMLFALSGCSDPTPESGNVNPPVVPPTDSGTKKEVMFLIDEGLKGEELIAIYKDDLNALDQALGNIYKGIAPLQEKYDVSVLIYPTWLYKESGYGPGSAATGINRIDPALIHTFNYFKEKKIGVYLEMYSSGIYTAQNGELGNLPLVKRRYSQTETIKSLPLDLDCLEDIFTRYDIVKGVRFHELIGSNDQKDNGHGFAVNLDLTTEIAEVCKKYNRRLVWGDHDWSFAYTNPAKYGFWLTYLEKACDILGDNITINFNNNGWGSEMEALQYTCTMANFRNNSKWGYSIQSWWWQEKDAQSLPKWENGSTRWYADAYLDMPVELMAAFSLETFRRGGSMIQFEPPFYLFNYFSPSVTPGNRVGQYEQTADYSGKLYLKRLVNILLDYDKNPAAYPSMNPAEYYVDNRMQMMDNKWSVKPKTYNQTTLGVLGDQTKFYDTYISNRGKWYNNDENRYRDWVLSGNVMDAIRVKVDFRLIDELLVLKSKNGKPVAEFYNNMSTYYTECDNLASNTSDGTFVSLTTLNLKQNYEGKDNVFFGDPDEVVVARSNGSRITFTVYEKRYSNNGTATRQNFTFAEEPSLTAQVNAEFGSIASTDFIQLLGMRTRNILYKDNTRPIDNLLAATKAANGKVQIKGKMQGSVAPIDITKTVDVDPSTIRDIKCMDANSDYVDEAAFLLNDDSIVFYECNVKGNNDFTLQSTLPKAGVNARKIVATRWTTYYKE